MFYREHLIGEHRLDFLVEGKVIVELKAISALEDIHFAIVRSYLKAANLHDALVLNFASVRLIVKRVGRERQRPKEKILSCKFSWFPGFQIQSWLTESVPLFNVQIDRCLASVSRRARGDRGV